MGIEDRVSESSFLLHCLKTKFFLKKMLDKELALSFLISNLASYIFKMEAKYINILNISLTME